MKTNPAINFNLMGLVVVVASAALGVAFTQNWLSPENFAIALGSVGTVFGAGSGGYVYGQRAASTPPPPPSSE